MHLSYLSFPQMPLQTALQIFHIFSGKNIPCICSRCGIRQIIFKDIRICFLERFFCKFSCTGTQIIHNCICTVEIFLRTALHFFHLDIDNRDFCNHNRDRTHNHHQNQNGKQRGSAIIPFQRNLFHRYSPFAEFTVIYRYVSLSELLPFPFLYTLTCRFTFRTPSLLSTKGATLSK